MNICSSCFNVRIGENNNGDTLPEAMEGIRNVAMMVPAMAYTMLEGMIPHAKKGGACSSCLNKLESLKSEMARKLS